VAWKSETAGVHASPAFRYYLLSTGMADRPPNSEPDEYKSRETASQVRAGAYSFIGPADTRSLISTPSGRQSAVRPAGVGRRAARRRNAPGSRQKPE